MRLMTLALAVLLPLATQAQAEDRPLYSAQETVRRAQVGSFSPRLAPPVRVPVPAEAGKPDRPGLSAWSAAAIRRGPWARLLFVNLGEPTEYGNPRINHPLG